VQAGLASSTEMRRARVLTGVVDAAFVYQHKMAKDNEN